jgi:predicted secreted protein
MLVASTGGRASPSLPRRIPPGWPAMSFLILRWNLRRAASCCKLLLLTFALLMAAMACAASTGQTSSSTPVTKAASPAAQNPQKLKTSVAATHRRSSRGKRSHRRNASWRKRGQRVIDSERARQIQEALVREHYLNGQPSGVWDSATQDAMVRYQEDHGWQCKVVPDSRALIELGLGPDQQNLLNPETAMTSRPMARVAPVSAPSVSRSNSARPVPTSVDPISGPVPPADPPNDNPKH